MSNFYLQLVQRNWLLTKVGNFFLLLFIVFFVAYWFDSRKILGLNPWVKPMKFALSIWAYVWTMGWLMAELSNVSKTIKMVSFGIAVSMIAEIVVIGVQAARGTTSHFNTTTPLNGILFSVMGSMIVINSLLVLGVLFMFFVQPTTTSTAYIWGIRLGLIIFLLASAEGGVMVQQKAHSVGISDGKSGIPFLNWSTLGGDLRIAHFVGIHALQMIPWSAWVFTQHQPRYAVLLTVLLAMTYALVAFGLFGMALAGKPLLRKW